MQWTLPVKTSENEGMTEASVLLRPVDRYQELSINRTMAHCDTIDYAALTFVITAEQRSTPAIKQSNGFSTANGLAG